MTRLLKNSHSQGKAAIVYNYGLTSDRPAPGDRDRDEDEKPSID